MTYWQVALIFSGIAALILCWPVLTHWFRRDPDSAASERVAANTRLYQEHVAELEQLRDNGDITEDEFATLKFEQQRALLSDAAILSAPKYRQGGPWLLLAAAVVVPLAALWAYHKLGARDDWHIHQMVQEWQTTSAETPELEAELRAELTRRLQARPDNTQNWYLLARLALNVQDFDQAVAAFQRIVEQEPDSPRMLAELAQAQFLQAGNQVTPEVRRNTTRALQLDPEMPTALGIAGIDAFQQGYFRQAIDFWSRAVDQLGEDAPGARALVTGIARAKSELEAQGESVDEPAGEAAQAGLRVSVQLAEGVDVDPSAAVFVYARAYSGPRMPLAIQRLTAGELPAEVTLTESMSMAPGLSMSQFDQLEVVARISESGNAVAQSGDWQATEGPVVLEEDGAEVSLIIGDRIP